MKRDFANSSFHNLAVQPCKNFIKISTCARSTFLFSKCGEGHPATWKTRPGILSSLIYLIIRQPINPVIITARVRTHDAGEGALFRGLFARIINQPNLSARSIRATGYPNINNVTRHHFGSVASFRCIPSHRSA